ncbi:MAG: hypothetical protein BECKG1743D_GA0114223_100244 [Candidatus Kentron sp. G]|nr:MAG: hypothetical protein BECKG1743D_GA0114223_100244 [Candidatus Kentron sp. G]
MKNFITNSQCLIISCLQKLSFGCPVALVGFRVDGRSILLPGHFLFFLYAFHAAIPIRYWFAIDIAIRYRYRSYPAFPIASSDIDSDPERTTTPVAPWLRYVIQVPPINPESNKSLSHYRKSSEVSHVRSIRKACRSIFDNSHYRKSSGVSRIQLI